MRKKETKREAEREKKKEIEYALTLIQFSAADFEERANDEE